MPHSFGYRARTRHLFARAFRKHGLPGLSTYLHTYHRGDFVDIKANGAIHKGMPHKIYHGRTGRIWDISPRAVGVEVTKNVGNRVIIKRVHVRVEHVKPSNCQQDFLQRVKHNAEIRKKWAADPKSDKKNPPCLKRYPGGPRPGKMVKASKTTVETVAPLRYTEVY